MRTPYYTVRNAFYKISGSFGYVGMAAMFFITCLMTVDVVLRLITSLIPGVSLYILGTYEMTEMMMVVIISFGYAVTQRDGGHVCVTLFTDRLPWRFKAVFNGCISALTTVTCLITTYCAFNQAGSFLVDGITTTTLFIPYYPFAYLMGIGFTLFTVILFFDTIDYFITAVKNTPPPQANTLSRK